VDGDIVVGAYLSMTGSMADFGVQTRRGFDMAFEEANAVGGVRGRRLRLIVLDDQGKAEEAGNAVARLIDVEGAVAVLGEVASSISLVGGRICQRRGVPMITPSSTNIAVTEIGDYIFRVCFIDPFQGYVMARFARENLRMTRVAVFRDVRNDYSVGLSRSFVDEFRRAGGQIVAEESYGAGDTDFGAQLTSIKAAAPEAIFVPGYYGDVGNIARQARRLGLRIPLLGGDGWDSPQLREIGGPDILGSYYSNHFAPDNPRPRARAFIDAYVRRYGEAPTSLAAQGYDAAMMLFDAMRRADDLSPRAIRDALAATTAFEGVTGRIAMDEHRNPVKPAVVLRVAPEGDVFETAIEPTVPGAHASTGRADATPMDLPQRPAGSGAGVLVQQIVNGLSAGSIYALIALGYTMVYGVLGLINFAHSEVFMMSAFAGFYAAGWFGYQRGAPFPLWAAAAVLVFAMAASAALGVTIERLAYRPVRDAPRLTPLITAIGVSLLLQNVGVLLFGATPQSFPSILAEARFELPGGVVVTNVKLVVFGVSLALMVALDRFVRRTWTGKAMRAVSVNPAAARLMGIDVDRVISGTFALGSALAAAGGILFGLDQTKIEPTMGVLIGLKAFVAAVLGGIGNIPGAVLGGIVIGLAEQLTAGYLSADYRDAITFVILIGVLLFRPQGLLGVVRQEKV
jgi:branched-chain amino acid transport system substrate-binding protein